MGQVQQTLQGLHRPPRIERFPRDGVLEREEVGALGVASMDRARDRGASVDDVLTHELRLGFVRPIRAQQRDLERDAKAARVDGVVEGDVEALVALVLDLEPEALQPLRHALDCGHEERGVALTHRHHFCSALGGVRPILVDTE